MKKSLPLLAILLTSMLHYITPLQYHHFHAVYQRLYYLPIIATAYWFGFRWGLGSAMLSGLLYVPHIFFQWGPSLHHETFTQYVEIAMFGGVAAMVGIFSEIQKTQQRKIAQASEQIRRMDRLSLLGQLAAGLAHEIRNPLGSLIGSTEILRADFPPGHEKVEFVDILHKELQRLNMKLDHFLHFAHPAQPAIIPNSINDVVNESVALVAKQAGQNGVIINTALDPHIPLVPMDSEQIKQVLLNLLLNAMQAMDHGGQVTVSTAQSDGWVAVAVEDVGPGIDDEHLPRIFEPFYTTKQNGTGLGLAIVLQLLEGMGGRVRVTSASHGSGARFEVRIPHECR